MKPLVIITDFEGPGAVIETRTLESIGAQVVRENCRTEDELIGQCAQADALMVGYARITRRVLDGLPRCRMISRYGIGMDMIDMPAATERGILVCNVPDYCIEEVATHAIALLLALDRQIVHYDRQVRSGAWNFGKVLQQPRRLSTCTLGVVGYGRIGKRVGELGAALGMRLLAHDPLLAADRFTGAAPVDLPTLLAESDFVTLHCPLTPATRHLISSGQFAGMRATAYLINATRGPVVDETALVQALKDKRIAGAALDVVEHEPIAADNPLLQLDNVILTPHAAHYSDAAIAEVRRRTAEHVVMFFTGEMPPTTLNPQVWRTPGPR